MSDLRFASYACGNRYYFEAGDSAPDECPRAECTANKTGVFDHV